jgi:hypothetical protein
VQPYAAVLTLDADENLRPVLRFLTSPLPRGGAGMSKKAAMETLRLSPFIFSMDVATNLRPKLEYLIHDLGLRPGDVAALTTRGRRHPEASLLRLDLESKIKPRVAFLAQWCYLGAAFIRRNPRILCEGIEVGLSLVTPGGCQIGHMGYMERTGCHRLHRVLT